MITIADISDRMFWRDSAAISSGAFNAAKVAQTDIKPKVTLERSNPTWTHRHQSRAYGNDNGFDVAQSNVYCLRIANDGAGHLKVDRQLAYGASGFSDNLYTYFTDVKASTKVRLHWDATNSVFRYWYINTSNQLNSGTMASDGSSILTGPTGVANSVYDFAVVKTDGSGYPLYYTRSDVGTPGTQLEFLDAAAVGYNTLFSLPFPPDSFDVCLFTPTHPNDNSTRHLLVMSANTAPIFAYKEVVGTTPQKEAMRVGGLYAFLITPPSYNSRGQNYNVGGPYPIQTFDNFIFSPNVRSGVRVSMIPSDFSPSAPDTAVLACTGSDGEMYVSGVQFFSSIYVYQSRDGKNWTQDKQYNAGNGVPGAFHYPVIIPQNGVGSGTLNMYGYGVWQSSPGCAEWFNAQEGATLFDVSDAILDFQTDWNSDVRTCSLTLDNLNGRWNDTFITDGSAVTLRMYMEYGGREFPVATMEVDAVQISRRLPVQTLNITARDRMAWLYDKSTCPDSRQFDNTIIGYDDFADIAGKSTLR